MAFAILAVCFTILILKVCKKPLSQFFSVLFQSETHTILFVSIGSLVAVRFYFSVGESSWIADNFPPNHLRVYRVTFLSRRRVAHLVQLHLRGITVRPVLRVLVLLSRWFLGYGVS